MSLALASLDPEILEREDPQYCPQNVWLIAQGPHQYFSFSPCGGAEDCTCSRTYGFSAPESALMAFASQDLIAHHCTGGQELVSCSVERAREIAGEQGDDHLIIVFTWKGEVRLLPAVRADQDSPV